jgi:hypothetical protein
MWPESLTQTLKAYGSHGFAKARKQSDPEGGIPSGPLEVLGRSKNQFSGRWSFVIVGVTGEFFRVMSSIVSFVSSEHGFSAMGGNAVFEIGSCSTL